MLFYPNFCIRFRILGREEWEDIGSVPRVDCESAKVKPEKGKLNNPPTDAKDSDEEESSGSESEDDGEGAKKKRIKEKVGFRDRKVTRVFTLN